MLTEQVLQQEMSTIKKILFPLLKNEDFQGIALISPEGTIISEILPENVDKDKFGTIIATLIGSSSIVMKQLKNEDLEKITIESEEGKLLVVFIEDYLITVALVKNADMNKAMKEIEEVVKNIKKVDYGK